MSLSKDALVEAGSPARRRQPPLDRERALDLALELFWRHGFEGVGIADLTRAIGVAPPSLYHAFGSKAGLYRQVLERYGAAGLSPEAIASMPSALAAAEALLEHGVAAVTSPGRPLGCMISSGLLMAGAEHAVLAGELRGLRDATREALRLRIVRDQEAGRLPPSPVADTLARFIVTVLQGLSVQALDGASSDELSAAAALALECWPRVTGRPR